jgi:hypothetical protein
MNIKFTQYPMWDDIRTYITSEINPQEKSSHIIMLHRFKIKEECK